MNIHTPERQPNESFEQYKQRRNESHAAAKAELVKRVDSRLYALHVNSKNTKHTRAESKKRKGAL